MQVWSLRSCPALAPCSDVWLLKIVTGAALENSFLVKGAGFEEVLRSLLCCILWLCDCISDFEMLLQRRNGGFISGFHQLLCLVLVTLEKSVISGFLLIFLYKMS